jgi:hypothetical protein
MLARIARAESRTKVEQHVFMDRAGLGSVERDVSAMQKVRAISEY